jgi:hypothetical protein
MTHYLIVTEPEPGYFEYDVEHGKECPKQKQYFGGFQPNDFSDERPYWEHYTCDVGSWSDDWGFIDLEDDPRFKVPGKYEIDFYSYWSGSMFEDSEAYIYFVEN